MIRGLLIKTLHEVWLPTCLFGGALCAVMMMLTTILPQFQEGLNDLLADIPFVKTMITALLGSEIADEINARMLQSVVWVHPVVLTILWGHEIVFCTRFPAGEIDRGTIDLLLGLPVSRRGVYFCDSFIWLVSGLLVLALGWVGYRRAPFIDH